MAQFNPAQLTTLYAEHFNGSQGEFSALVSDSSSHTSHVRWATNALGVEADTFDGMESEIIGADIDQDGDIDLLSSTMQGYVLAENTGGTWTTTNVVSSLILTNASIADHNGDGNVSLLVPQLTSGDGNSQTVEGNITLYNITTTSITPTQTVLEPWSCPTDSKYIDMDADGLSEHIVSAGEGNLFGLFIGSWNSIGMDIDQNGQNDLVAYGYAGDGQHGTPPLEFEDPLGKITTLLIPLTSSPIYTLHDYDIKMNLITYEFTNSGNGYFIENCRAGYDIDFIVNDETSCSGQSYQYYQSTSNSWNWHNQYPVTFLVNEERDLICFRAQCRLCSRCTEFGFTPRPSLDRRYSFFGIRFIFMARYA